MAAQRQGPPYFKRRIPLIPPAFLSRRKYPPGWKPGLHFTVPLTGSDGGLALVPLVLFCVRSFSRPFMFLSGADFSAFLPPKDFLKKHRMKLLLPAKVTGVIIGKHRIAGMLPVAYVSAMRPVRRALALNSARSPLFASVQIRVICGSLSGLQIFFAEKPKIMDSTC